MRWWRLDLTRENETRLLFKAVKPELVYNASGLADGRPNRDLIAATFRDNALATLYLFSAAREVGCERVIHCGSMQESAGGEGGVSLGSAYSVSKWVASTYAQLFRQLYQLLIMEVRFSIVYGPGNDSPRKLIPYVITSLLNGQAPRLDSGQRPIDWLYIEDVVDALISAGEASDVSGLTVDVGWGIAVPIREVVERIAALIDNGVEPVFGASPDRPYEWLKHADPENIRQCLGWCPQIPFSVGLPRTIEWYRRNYRK